MKVPLVEAEREALEDELAAWSGRVSSALLGVEAARAAVRKGRLYVARTRTALDQVLMIPIDGPVLDAAAGLPPTSLRALDAIHLATALSLGDDLGVFVAYDHRLLDAARDAGLPTASPGA